MQVSRFIVTSPPKESLTLYGGWPSLLSEIFPEGRPGVDLSYDESQDIGHARDGREPRDNLSLARRPTVPTGSGQQLNCRQEAGVGAGVRVRRLRSSAVSFDIRIDGSKVFTRERHRGFDKTHRVDYGRRLHCRRNERVTSGV